MFVLWNLSYDRFQIYVRIEWPFHQNLIVPIFLFRNQENAVRPRNWHSTCFLQIFIHEIKLIVFLIWKIFLQCIKHSFFTRKHKLNPFEIILPFRVFGQNLIVETEKSLLFLEQFLILIWFNENNYNFFRTWRESCNQSYCRRRQSRVELSRGFASFKFLFFRFSFQVDLCTFEWRMGFWNGQWLGLIRKKWWTYEQFFCWICLS